MRRYKGTFDIFFGVEHRVRKEENGGALSTRKPNKVGDLQQTQQVSLTRKQSVRIVSTRQEEVFVAIDGNLGAAYWQRRRSS